MIFKRVETIQKVREHFYRSYASVILVLEQRQNAKGVRLCSSVKEAKDFEIKIKGMDRQPGKGRDEKVIHHDT